MSFTLKSIELNNIRAHKHFLFEPALSGITAISGANGSGKSTIVDAFAWGLYGTRPTGVRNKNLIRDGVDPRKKKVSVKAIVNIGGIEYAIERKIINPQGSTECNVWGKTEDGEYSQIAGPAVSHVEKFIRNEIGMNEKGFLTSVLIQQKQVDQIVSATPRERGVVIEELTGIASITEAIQKTNENTRALEKASSIFSIGNIDEAEAKVEKQREVCNKIKEREKDAISKFNDTKEHYAKISKDLEVQKHKVEQRRKLTNEINNLNEQIEFLKNQSEEDLNYILDFKNKYGSTVYIDTKERKKELDKKRNENFDLQSQLNKLSDSIKTNDKDIDKCNLLKDVFETEKEAREKLKSLEDKLKKDTNNLEELKAEKSMLTSELKHSRSSHSHIDGEEKNCPVCKSHIDNPEQLKKEIEEEIDGFKKRQAKVNKEIKVSNEKVEKLNDKIKTTNIAIEAIKEKKRLEKENKINKTTLNKLINKKELVEDDLKVLEEEYNKALRIEADKKSLESAKERSLTVNTKIDERKDSVKEKEKEIKDVDSLTDRSYNALEKRVDQERERLTKMSIAGKEIVGRKKLEQERLQDNKNNLKEVKDAMKKYNEIAEQIDISTSASQVLTSFKADRIEHAIPTLEFYASDFLSKFTGGSFSKMTVDEKFNTFVTTSAGVVRPVAQLSGGELSSAAIALRLGIAMLLNSSDKNVLILDEVLVSMDEDRSRQIMETIGSMTNSQVIFIAHNTDINAVADKTVMVSKS